MLKANETPNLARRTNTVITLSTLRRKIIKIPPVEAITNAIT